MIGLAACGGVRLGLEDMIWMDEERTTLATNSGLIKLLITISSAMGKSPMSPIKTRKLFKIT